MRTLATYLRGLDPQLPRTVWLVQAGGVVNALGNGIVFPFAIIYLHNVRGISFAQAGFALAIGGAAALAAGLIAGPLVDRVGGRNTLVFGLLLQLVAFTLFPLIREAWHAYALFALEGVGTACFWPGQSTLLARLTPAENRHSAYALQRVSMNLGIGLGGVVGGLIATTADPGSFTRMFLLDAATFLVFAALLLFGVHEPPATEAEEQRGAGQLPGRPARPQLPRAHRPERALRRGRLRGLRAAAAVRQELRRRGRALDRLHLAGEHAADRPDPAAGLEGARGPPPDGRARADERALGGRRADRAGGGGFFNGTSAALVFMTATMVFAIGETLQGPTQAPLVADLAPERLRGRYFALGAMSWSAGSILGPAVGGPLLGWHPLAVWPISAGVCVFAATGCLRLEQRLPERVRRTPRPEPVAQTALAPPLDLATERL